MGEIRCPIPNKLHKELKQVALDRGTTLKQLIVDIFERYTEEHRQQKSLTIKMEKEVAK